MRLLSLLSLSLSVAVPLGPNATSSPIHDWSALHLLCRAWTHHRATALICATAMLFPRLICRGAPFHSGAPPAAVI